MKQFNIILVFSAILLFSCESSLNGPVGSNLIYESFKLSVGQEVNFGTIDKDVIKVKLAEKNKNNYILQYPNNKIENCPLHASNLAIDLTMYDDKYKVTFNYKTTEDGIVLQLYKYEILQ